MQNQNEIKFNDVPFGTWLFGFAFLGGGIFFLTIQRWSGNTFAIGGIGLALLLLNWGLTIRADRNTSTLRLEYWSLYFLRKIKEIPFSEIETIRVTSTRSSTRTNHKSRSYRLELVRKDKTVVPFRTSYGGGFFGKQKIADELRAFIGLGPVVLDESPIGVMRAAAQLGAERAEQIQEIFTGPNEEIRITNGVHWQLQSSAMGTSPVTRWFSPDYKMQAGFLFLAQKVAGQSSGGLMASIGNMVFKQSITLYGFKAEDIPNLAQAEVFPSLPSRVDFHFTAFTNNLDEARQILNPWVQNPLAEWGQRYPLKQLQAAGRFSQLIVLFSPNGVYLATMGNLQPDQVEELTALGVEMVKAQGSVP
jgi:hypothetical protein